MEDYSGHTEAEGARHVAALASVMHRGGISRQSSWWKLWRQRRGAAFTRAYALGLSHRLPLLYLVATFAVLLLSLRFANTAPLILLAVGLALASFTILRAGYWLPRRAAKRSSLRQRADLDRMALRAGLSALIFVTWCLALQAYGDPDQRAFVQYVMAVTMFSGILGLAHAPRTSLALAAAFTIPATVYGFTVEHPNSAYVAVVQLIVTAILLLVAQEHHRDFIRLEISHQLLARRERQTARLADAHFRQATIDALTGGRNRRAILARLERELGGEDEDRAWLALLDLDGFKHVNDTYGHATGDVVLRTVSQRIGECADVIAHGRLGGDEFAILFDGKLDADAVVAVCRELSDAIRQPITHNGVNLRLCGSIGLHHVGAEQVSGCLERADAALYKAKKAGDGAVTMFGPDDEMALQRRITITRQFNDCPLRERLKLLYQPVYDHREKSVIGLEALARWSPDGVNWLAPADFLSIAEATGRTGELTRMVMARALSECSPAITGLALSINLAPRDLLREGTVEAIADIVASAGADPSSILLEMTESAILGDPRRATAQLRAFRARGFRIALDDFGAGWSSLSHLRELPLDQLKLDRQIAAAIVHDPSARAMAGMIVALAWQLGIACSIEGIENIEQVEAARGLGIHLMQGYHFGHPEDASTVLAGRGGVHAA